MQAKQLGRRTGRALRPADDMADDPAGDLAGDLAGNMAGDPAGQVAATTLTWLRPGSAVLAIRQAIRHVTGSSHTGGMASSLASTHADGPASTYASSLASTHADGLPSSQASSNTGGMASSHASDPASPPKNTAGRLAHTPQRLDAGGSRAQTADLQYFMLSHSDGRNGNRISTAQQEHASSGA